MDGVAESRKLCGKLGQENLVIAAAKGGAPTEKKGWVSNKSALTWAFSGGNKSAHSTWAQRTTAATAIIRKGSDKGQALATKAAGVAKKTKAFSQPIATHSHECKDPSCRQPVKITSKMNRGKQFPNLLHRCLATNGNVGGLVNHLCSTCHRTGLVCKD